MTTSGSHDFAVTGTDIATEALELIGKAGAGYPPSGEEIKSVLRTLNMMVKQWTAEGVGLWKIREATLFLDYNQNSYDIGSTGDHCSFTAYKTEVATAASSGASTISVDSDDNFTAGDYLGIELDSGYMQWTNVSGTPTGDVVTLSTALSGAVSIDNHVYNYTTKAVRPTGIIEARLINEDGTESVLEIISNTDYRALSDKTSLGSPTQIYYSPLLTNWKLYTWPTCNNAKEYIKFTCKIPLEDFDAAANTADVPQFYFMPLSWNLAVHIAPKFGKTLDASFQARAEMMKASAKGFDMEDTSIFFRSDYGWR